MIDTFMLIGSLVLIGIGILVWLNRHNMRERYARRMLSDDRHRLMDWFGADTDDALTSFDIIIAVSCVLSIGIGVLGLGTLVIG